jgi:hypothetical protein
MTCLAVAVLNGYQALVFVLEKLGCGLECEHRR